MIRLFEKVAEIAETMLAEFFQFCDPEGLIGEAIEDGRLEEGERERALLMLSEMFVDRVLFGVVPPDDESSQGS